MVYGVVRAPETGEVLDDGYLVLFEAPRTYTGEDVAELHLHGSPPVVRRIVELLVQCGARPAEPGEFTKRAFLKGRLSLSQAEAVAAFVTAKTEAAARMARRHLDGALGSRLASIGGSIASLAAKVELGLDFPEEDDPPYDEAILEAEGRQLVKEVRALVASYARGRALRKGVELVIVGKPNVGKSSLFNALVGSSRALVAPTPGTTRDWISAEIELSGLAVTLVDTAGVREASDDPIEAQGVARTTEKLASADGCLLLVDGTMPLSREDLAIIETVGEVPTLLAVTKADLGTTVDLGALPRSFSTPPVVVSATTGQGLATLTESLQAVVPGGGAETDEVVLLDARHEQALIEVRDSLVHAVDGLGHPEHAALASADLRRALDSLGAITGEALDEHVLDLVFSSFCIGK